ncbi:MAG TPA: hypothetical protein VMC43_01265 [Candidatus Paceibacterota bacterium]|nr:hypothetical protein [Candidatus Paceibacterota bacterium]
MFCARANRVEDPAARRAEEVRDPEEAAEALFETIVLFEAEHYCPDEHNVLNARCVDCGDRTQKTKVRIGEEEVEIFYCPTCQPGLRGHPAEYQVYV